MAGSKKQSLREGFVGGILLFATVIPVAIYFGMKFAPQFSWVGALGEFIF